MVYNKKVNHFNLLPLLFKLKHCPRPSVCNSVAGQAGSSILSHGKDLPWVETADHLCRKLFQKTSMEKAYTRARDNFIPKIVELREWLSFA